MTLVLVLAAVFAVWWMFRKAALRPPSGRHEANFEADGQVFRASGTESAPPLRSKVSRGSARWVPLNEAVRVKGASIPRGLVYVGDYLESPGKDSVEPALIDPRLAVDLREPDYDDGMGYWPEYHRISAANRGAYLSWLAGGRSHPAACIGYVFLFFYGLERRVLYERADVADVRSEVLRLQGLYAGNRSFRGYSSDFMAFTAHMVPDIAENDLRQQLAGALESSELARASLLAWYCQRGLPLPPACAAAIASSMEDAKRGVVVARARPELYSLFAKRYLEEHGHGIKLTSAAREVCVSYRAASPGLAFHTRTEVRLPNPMGKPSQFKPLVGLWNSCVEDLRKYSSAQRKTGGTTSGELTAAMWEAMPAELRAQHDHPDQERWESAIRAGRACGHGHVATARALGELSGAGVRDRYTNAQLRKAANTAAAVGFAIEPDPRATSGSCDQDALFVIWPGTEEEPPDPSAYVPAATVLKLAMHVAQADGTVDPQELSVMAEVLETVFALDEPLRRRLEHLRELLVLQPVKATALAKKIAESSTLERREAVGRLLVAIAAADGVLQAAEHKALRAIYKALELPVAALDGAVAATGIRLGVDEAVSVARAERASPGSAVTPPPSPEGPAMRLNRKAIDAILADTREVAGMLAEALGEASDQEEQALMAASPVGNGRAVSSGQRQPTAVPAPPWASVARDLEPSYREVLYELTTREHWTAKEVQALASQRRMMPGAILETINAWADDALGDHLITGDDSWTVRTDLIRSMAS